MADIRQQNNASVDESSELEVLLALRENIFKTLKVGSFAEVKSIDEDNKTAMVTLFPAYKNEIEITISVTTTASVEIQEHDLVVVLFLDTNFRSSLRQALKQQKRAGLDTNDITMHSINYGVIIASMSREYTPIEMIPILNKEIEEMFEEVQYAISTR